MSIVKIGFIVFAASLFVGCATDIKQTGAINPGCISKCEIVSEVGSRGWGGELTQEGNLNDSCQTDCKVDIRLGEKESQYPHNPYNRYSRGYNYGLGYQSSLYNSYDGGSLERFENRPRREDYASCGPGWLCAR